MPAALLSAISAWQLLQDLCLVLFLGFISAFQLSGPLCTHCDSIGNIMYVLAWVFLKELALIQKWKSFQGCQSKRMPENTNSPWIKAFVLLFAYTFAISSWLNINKLSNCQSRITLALKSRVLLKVKSLTDTVAPLNLCSIHHDALDLRRDISHVLLKSGSPWLSTALPQTASTTVSKGIAAANKGTKAQSYSKLSLGLGEEIPWGCTASLAKGKVMGAVMLWADPRQYQQRHHYTNTRHWPTCPGSPKVIVPMRSPVPTYPLLAHLPAGLRETSWWKYVPMVSTRFLIFQTSTLILK